MKNYKIIIIALASLLLASCSTQRKTLTFICFGDWGRDGNFGQKETAEQMGIYAKMYICGHDHDMQYLKESGSKVNYFVAGSGSQLRPAGKMDYTI